MDTQHLPYRLKTARRKRQLLIKDRDKQLLKLDRERERINRDPEYKRTVLLDEPYQKGWKRLFVLKTEVAKSDKAEFYQEILNWINDVQYHYDRSFKNSKRVRRWNKYYHAQLPRLKRYEQPYWKTGKFKLNEEQCACFHTVQYWNEEYYRWEYCYEFSFPDLFEIAVLPNMITTVKVGDALLEQRLAWIDNQFYKNNKRHRLNNLQQSYNGWKDRSEQPEYVNPLKNMQVWRIAAEYD